MARLKLVQSGIARERVNKGITKPDKRLPITVPIFRGLLKTWTLAPTDGGRAPARYEYILLRSAAALCFFGFFRSGEITVPTASFDEWIHLAWGDVATDDASPLKRSKCDQMGLGVDVYVGRTGVEICPVSLTLCHGARSIPRALLPSAGRSSADERSPKSAKPYLLSGLSLRRRQRRQAWRTPSYSH